MTITDTTTAPTEDTTPKVPSAEKLPPAGAEQPAHQGDPNGSPDVIDAEVEEGNDDNNKSGQEAAKYRRRLRETEAERDAVRDQLTALQRQVVEDASNLKKPGALWLSDLDASTLFDASGRLDTEKVAAEVARVADELGLTEKPRTPRPDPSQGGGLGNSSGADRASWADVVRRASGT